MDYEMMVKCAYEEIVGGIEKEAAGYAAGLQTLGQKLDLGGKLNVAKNVSANNSAFRSNIGNMSQQADKLKSIGRSMSTRQGDNIPHKGFQLADRANALDGRGHNGLVRLHKYRENLIAPLQNQIDTINKSI